MILGDPWEGLAVGLLASGAGLVAGVGIAKGLNEVFSYGIDLPAVGTVVMGRTVLVSMSSGTLITGVIASVVPALHG